ncbi:MAG: phosphatidylglycerophosphatase A, partial [Methylophilaceae bacterium]
MKANKLLYKNLSAFLALGFGTGLSKKAPGTLGTLMAIPIFLISELLPGNINYLFVITLFF